ncbi:MAG: sulfotransferase [Pseudomonadota bacterium]
MSLPPPYLSPVFARIKIGDLPGALASAEQVLRSLPKDQPLLALAGMLACRTGDLPKGIARLREALALAPEDQATRNNLIRALIETRSFDAAADVCSGGGRDPRMLRLSAYIEHQRGNLDRAIADYEAVVAALPDDFESWNNLGNLHAANHYGERAEEPLRKAIALRPDIALPYINLAKLLGGLRRTEDSAALLRDGAAALPDNAEVRAELGLAEAELGNFAAAETAYRAAIDLSPGFTPAYLDLAVLLDSLNKVDALVALSDAARAKGIADDAIGFLHAAALRRRNAHAEALDIARGIPAAVNPVRRNQLVGELADRLGDTELAFEAFTAMNQAARTQAGADADRTDFMDEIIGNAERLTPERVAAWPAVAIDPAPPSPIFLVGFPRSGTTLLDTLLMNIPSLHVLEELPIVRAVQTELGDPDRIDTLTSDEANALRRTYFETLDRIAPPAPGQRIVDKFPLHMARMGMIHRLFPDAKVIFVERHPYDSVLSAFMSSFELNPAMLSFTSLEGGARLYDAASTAWARAEALLPMNVCRMRYERMVEDLEGEMRRLLDFLDIPWDDKVLDNRGSAARREHIRTASYAQVSEPIYNRAIGRWQRYRPQLEPVLPILAPWAAKMGYDI